MKSGFSLVELSIVLVILGLLTGGILAGQSLIRAAELRSVASDFQRHAASIHAFRDKYQAFPGDMRNATRFWDTAAGSTGLDNTCYDVFKTTAATCNGNGDGRVFILNIGGTHEQVERFLVWQHLANAGLIEGSYIARSNDASVFGIAVGRNSPASKLSNGYFDVWGEIYVNTFLFNGQSLQQNIVSFYGPAANNYSILKPEEAWNLDMKFDDGRPGYGSTFTYKNTSTVGTDCATTDDATTAEYAVTNTQPVCVLHIKL